ncbi:MAG: glycoside hydrolase family 43 protein [Clostridiales bacterium]|nr:glycoside hydrolase family 43 protein [Clostridiales bacterium]
MPYICVHFKEKTTPDGEQVYFAVSKDGFNWESLNNSNPVLTCDKGEMGCRDIEIVRLKKGGFVILATDLCIVHRIERDGKLDWKQINSHGSKNLSMWKSDDLIHFSQQKLIYFGRDDFGCLWAPEVFYDEESDEYLIHWGSTIAKDNFTHMSIYSCTTNDFESFTPPRLFFEKDNEILDSHITKVEKTYHLFYKNSDNPAMNMHATSQKLYGPYENDSDFQNYMESLYHPGSYEAPTTYTLPDGRWCMMLDFFGCEKEKMGYVPFISPTVGDSNFVMSKDDFTFPYGFKHGKVIEITDEEYASLKSYYADN